jgi:hypothetical protein
VSFQILYEDDPEACRADPSFRSCLKYYFEQMQESDKYYARMSHSSWVPSFAKEIVFNRRSYLAFAYNEMKSMNDGTATFNTPNIP